MKLIKIFLFGILLNIGFSTVAFASISIIVHPENTSEVNKTQLRKIYLGKSLTYPDGSHVIPLDISSGKTRDFFNKAVMNKAQHGLNAYWSRMIFSGKGKPPKEVDGYTDVLEIVSKNKSAIGYVSSDEVDNIHGKARVILIIE